MRLLVFNSHPYHSFRSFMSHLFILLQLSHVLPLPRCYPPLTIITSQPLCYPHGIDYWLPSPLPLTPSLPQTLTTTPLTLTPSLLHPSLPHPLSSTPHSSTPSLPHPSPLPLTPTPLRLHYHTPHPKPPHSSIPFYPTSSPVQPTP